MLPDYEIVLGRGIGEIILGMTKDELAGILGEPDEIDTFEEIEKKDWESYRYDILNCSFTFDPDHEDRLIEISIDNEYFHIGHFIRIGVRQEEIVSKRLEEKYGNYMIKDMGDEEFPTRELMSFDDVGLNLWFDFGRVSIIQISILTSKDLIIWPE